MPFLRQFLLRILLVTASTVAVAQEGAPLSAPAPPAAGPQPGATNVAQPVAPDVTAPLPATTPPPPAAGFARQDGTPAPIAMPVATPAIQPAAGPAVPQGATVSAMQARGRMIENTRPERVQVYPDDPESAWWEINPHFAFDRAQREQKPLLLLFTGQWNTQAMALSEEVFATKSFNEYVKENLVICYLDYPRNITDAHQALRNIKEKFKVRGYPNVLLFNPNGEVERGIRGYRSGRPVDYFWELKNTCAPILKSIEEQKVALLRYGYRDWSNYQGKVIFAKFVDRDETMTRLQDVSGAKWTIKINDLAPDDQRLVESFPPVESIDPPESDE